MDPIAFFGLFFALSAVALVVFVLWLAAAVVRGVGRLIAGAFRLLAGPPDAVAADPHATRCPRRDCLSANPVEARFCRRCGHAMPATSIAADRPRLMSAA